MADGIIVKSGELSPEHAEYLTKHAVDLDVARSLGVQSLVTREDVAARMPKDWKAFANVPAIAFPWVSPEGRMEWQVRPDTPSVDRSTGRPRKYVFRTGATQPLWVVRDVPSAERVLIVEGTKQALVAASYAPEGIGVYGIAGCRAWLHDGSPLPDLAVAEDRVVVVLFDADAANNLAVYMAGLDLTTALTQEGASKVLFSRMMAKGTAGLDDVLAARPHERRASYLLRMIDGAKVKPADSKPSVRRKKPEPGGDPDRVRVVCNTDRFTVINALTDALVDKWNGTSLFNHGGVISQLKSNGMSPVDRGTSRDLIQATCRTVDEVEDQGGTRDSWTWPDPSSIAAVLSRSDRFAPLDGLAHAPYVREDGAIISAPGYDESTRTILLADSELTDIKVPEEPSPGEIEQARELIMTEWLGDFPFEGDADRANALGLVLTPAVRKLVARVPLAVVDGLQMGVGKNLLADMILTVYTGEAAKPLPFVDDREEMRKQLTSAFRTGAEFFVFDEAHVIEGAALAQVLTAATWQDRILGVSTMAEFPNRVTWMSLGNNVQVRGDLTRRVYRIALRPTYDNPQDRPSSSFRHPGQSGLDLGSWTRKHRRDLLTAILTLVRAWFAAGQPYPARGVSFGSFETWERTVGGIVEVAGLPGFLGNLTVWRSESDFDTQYWQGHLEWLREQFGEAPFRTADVKAKALTDPANYPAPPKLDDPADKGYGKALGEAYSRQRGRRYGGLWVERAGFAHGHVSLWRVGVMDEVPPPPPPAAPDPDPQPDTHPAPCGYPDVIPCICTSTEADDSDLLDALEDRVAALIEPAAEDQDGLKFTGELAEQVVFDLETGDADDLHRTGPGFVRLSGWRVDATPAQIEEGAAGPELVAQAIEWGQVSTGHNIMAFDLPALVREGAMTMERVHELARDGRLFDAILVARHIDPPMARDKGVDATRKYDLSSLGEKYELGRKDSVIEELKRKHGGWGNIPVDEASEDGRLFRRYLGQDLNLSGLLRARLLEELGGQLPPYLLREHRVAAIAAQISYNGFLVDRPALDARIAEIEARKARAMKILAGRYQVPTTTAAGKEAKSPLGTKGGKEGLEKALREAGATSIWTTPSTGQIDISVEHMRHLGTEYWHLKDVRIIAKAVELIVSARSVYETAFNCLAPDGRVHPKIGFEQATGRWSLTKPGLTVFGKRGGRHVERMIFLPDPGEVVIAVDLSQVDMRAVAGLSGDEAYIQMLMREDPHAEIARLLFGDPALREVAKPIGHGWNYGRGIKAISESNEIDPALVRQFDESMHQRFPRLVEWQEEVRALAQSGVMLDNGFGRPMRADPQRAHTQGPALMGQGAARDIMMTGLLNIADRHPEVLPMLRAQVHDEIVLSVPAEQAEEIGRAVVDALSFECRGVPILADMSRLGQTWGHVYQKD